MGFGLVHLRYEGDQLHNLYAQYSYGRMLQASHRAPKEIKSSHERSGSSENVKIVECRYYLCHL